MRAAAAALLLLAALGTIAPGDAAAQDLPRAKELHAEALRHLRQGRYPEGIARAKEALAVREQALGLSHPDVAESLQTLGDLLRPTADYAGARASYERALKIREQALGPAHGQTATTLNALGFVLYLQGDYPAARPHLERALKIREQQFGPTHSFVAITLNDLGLLLRATGDFTAARASHERALRIREQNLGPSHPAVATSLNNLAELFRDASDYAGARPLYERALQIREQALGPAHPDTATTLSSVGFLLYLQGDYAGAQPLLERALRIREQALGPDHPVLAFTLNDLALVLRVTGDLAAARAFHQRALRIREQRLGPGHPAVAVSLHNLADVLRDTGDYAGARPLFERALKIREQALGPAHPDTATALNGLGFLLYLRADYAAARPLLERALRIREQALGADHPALAFTLSDLALLLQASGDRAGARRLYERALRIREQALGPTHPLVAITLHGLADLLRRMRDHGAARPLFERALRIREQALGPTHPAVAATLNGLAALLQATGDHAGARPLLERALRIREQTLGRNHPAVALNLNTLAFLHHTRGDHASASPLYERALAIARSAATPELQWRAAFGLGRIHERQGRQAEALPLYREAVKTLEGLAGQFGEEGQRSQFLQAENRLAPYEALARLLLKLHEQDGSKGYDRDAWAVLEAKKGRLVAEALAGARPKLQDAQARAEAEKTQAKQEQALALEDALREEQAKPASEQRPEKLQSLTTLLAQTKADYLAQVQAFLTKYPQYKAQFVDQQTVDPKMLAKFADRLPAGTVAVQYFSAPDSLYLFVAAPGGRFQVKRQTVAQTDLYALIKQYRQHMDRAVKERLPWADDGSEAYRREVLPLKDVMARLATHLLAPIESELQAHRDLILIPNDLLLYLPIHALTRLDADGRTRFLGETHAVSYVTQLELVDLLNPSRPARDVPVLALANPDGSLPGASQEVRALRRMRPAVTTLEGDQATKAQFLGLVSKFPDLHLATHGVLDPQRPELSYLLMAGPDDASRRLGIAEIAGLSMAPNGLAILSACETAVGEQVPGASLLTLAAAFSQAGAQSIVATLWKVEDKATRDFMAAFHGALATSGRAQALNQAQHALLGNPATAHPYYWAPFILIGAR